METKIFKGDGEAFSALREAQRWLEANGYSYGPTCVNCPQGVVKGDAFIAKWRNLSAGERKLMDGKLYAGREGDARLVLTEQPFRLP